jgi:hypothetical protein
MNSQRVSCFAACVFIACSLQGQGTVNPEFETLKAQFEQKVKEEVMSLFDAGVADLKNKYSAALARAMETAQQDGKLDDAVAIKAENESIASGADIPVKDEETAPAALKQLRLSYRGAVARLEAERDQRLKPLQSALGTAVGTLVASLTREQKVQEALAVKQQGEALATANGAVLLALLKKKVLMGDIPVNLSASVMKPNAMKLGHVIAGQKVTVKPVKVEWSGGGSKRGVFTDWRGHNPDKLMKNQIPWMALVAAVGPSEHWAKDNTLSFTVPEDGELLLYANDALGDNKGEAEVVVTVTAN